MRVAIMYDSIDWIVNKMSENIIKYAPKDYEFTKFDVNISYDELLELANTHDIVYSSFWQPFCRHGHILKDDFPKNKVLIQVHHLMEKFDHEYDNNTDDLLCAKHIAYYSRNGQESLGRMGYKGNLYKLNQYVDSNDFKHIKPVFDNKLIIGSFGAVDRVRKAFWVLKDALKLLPDAELVITRGNVKGDNVMKAGRVTDNELIDLFKSINVYVSTANTEGGPMGVLEAMACGIPVVVTNTGFAGDIIKHGVNGFIIPFQNPTALKDRLEWIKNNYEEAMAIGENGRKTVAKYGPEEFSKQYIKLLNKIIEGDT